ncbi:hypothetical protein F4782DRAFT_530022 [Xylaria castorea]|nr:hypothetical protein F4782DRAFT_530022 [Xylaria castorea]
MDADLQQVLDALVRAPRDVDKDIQLRFANIISLDNVNHFEMVNSLTHSTTNLCGRLAIRLALWYAYQDNEYRTTLSLLDEPNVSGNTDGADARAMVHRHSRLFKFRLHLAIIEEELGERLN